MALRKSFQNIHNENERLSEAGMCPGGQKRRSSLMDWRLAQASQQAVRDHQHNVIVLIGLECLYFRDRQVRRRHGWT